MRHKDELQAIMQIEANHLLLVSKVHRTVIHQQQVLRRAIIMEVADTKAQATCTEINKT